VQLRRARSRPTHVPLLLPPVDIQSHKSHVSVFLLPPSRPPTSACTFVPGHFISSRFVQSSRTLNPALTSERRLRNYLTGLTHTYALTFTLLHLQTLAYPALTCQPRHRRFQLGRSRHLTSSRARTPLRHLTSLQYTLEDTSFSPMPYT
jgi:hypothetical protein